MEDYIQGVLCGYLTVQNGTKNDAKRRRMFVLLSDARMDYYVTDPRPTFEESITESYTFGDKTQVHHYAEINPRAPPFAICLTTDKMNDVYIADNAHEADVWYSHLSERLQALHQMVVGTLLVRKELSVDQQLQRALLQTKYTWRLKHAELGRATLRYCGTQSGRKTQRAMNQFTLTAESYVSEEPVEVLKSVPLARVSVSSGALSAADLKKIQKDPTLQKKLGNPSHSTSRTSRSGSVGGLVYPFVVCTGPAHLHVAVASEKERDEWVVAIKMRVITLKYKHNARRIPTDSAAPSVRMYDFMEVQLAPGGAWKRRYVELENEMLKVKRSDRTLGSKLETRLLPSCVVTASLVKPNGFTLENLGVTITLAPGSLQDSLRWQKTLRGVARNVSRERSYKVFDDDVRALLASSVVYRVDVAQSPSAASDAGFVLEKHKKRITVLSHQSVAPTTPTTTAPAQISIPQGSVLLAIYQHGMVHDSFETIWHKLRQKNSSLAAASSSSQTSASMTLAFRAPMHKTSLVDVQFHKLRDKWTLRRCVLQHGKLRVDDALADGDPVTTSPSSTTSQELKEVALRDCTVELLSAEATGVRNVIKISVAAVASGSTAIYLRVHHDGNLFAWFTLLLLECGIAQDDAKYPLTLQTLKKTKHITKPSPHGDDQRRQTTKCTIAGRLLSEIEQAAVAQEPKLVHHARAEQQQRLLDDQLPAAAPDSPLRSLVRSPSATAMALVEPTTAAAATTLNESDAQALFQILDAIGCGKISSAALSSTIDALTRQLEPLEREQLLELVHAELRKMVPASRQFASITVEQAASVLAHIHDPRVVELVRKFARHEVQCL